MVQVPEKTVRHKHENSATSIYMRRDLTMTPKQSEPLPYIGSLGVPIYWKLEYVPIYLNTQLILPKFSKSSLITC